MPENEIMLSVRVKSIARCPLDVFTIDIAKKIIKDIENTDDFHLWLVDPIDQVYEILGRLSNPEIKEFPGVKFFYSIWDKPDETINTRS